METIDAPLMGAAAGLVGYMIGGFIIAMLPAFVFIRLAGSPKRRPNTAANLRLLGVASAAGLTVLGAMGGRLNIGSALALLLAAAWALMQHRRASKQKPA